MSSILRDPHPFRARSRHGRDEIALFLAKAALAAGPAVMEEYDRGCEVASKKDGSPVTSADHRAEAIICDCLASLVPSTPRMRRGSDRGRSAASSRRAVPAGRSARRNAGISRRQRRVYDQCRADREGRSDRWRRLRARDRPIMGRRRHGFHLRIAAWRRIAGRGIAAAHSHSPRASEPGRFCKPFASRSQVGRLPQRIADRRDAVCGLLVEVLPYRRGRWRRLSAVRANDGMGHGGGRRGAARGRRRRPRSFRTAASLRQSREQIAQRLLHCLG